MQIYNPSNKAIVDIKIFGVSYSIDAEGTLDNVPETVARYWQENLHKFLQIKKDGLEKKVVEEVEIKEPEVKPVLNTDETVVTEDKEVEDEVVIETVTKPIKKIK